MKNITIVLLLYLPLFSSAQNFREGFLGSYSCNVYQGSTSGPPTYIGTGSAVVSISSTDTNYILISLTDTFYSNVVYDYKLSPDSTFQNVTYPNNWNGKFFSSDSIYVYFNHISSVTDFYYGKKLTVGITESLAKEIRVYPNPAHRKLIIDQALTLNKIQLYNLKGDLVFLMEPQRNSTIEIDVSKFEQGVYLLQVTDGKNTVTKKIIIEQ